MPEWVTNWTVHPTPALAVPLPYCPLFMPNSSYNLRCQQFDNLFWCRTNTRRSHNRNHKSLLLEFLWCSLSSGLCWLDALMRHYDCRFIKSVWLWKMRKLQFFVLYLLMKQLLLMVGKASRNIIWFSWANIINFLKVFGICGQSYGRLISMSLLATLLFGQKLSELRTLVWSGFKSHE